MIQTLIHLKLVKLGILGSIAGGVTMGIAAAIVSKKICETDGSDEKT